MRVRRSIFAGVATVVASGALLAAVILSSIGVHAAGALAVDAKVSTHATSASSTIVSPAFSTTQAKEVVLAFIDSDGPNSGGGQSISGVTGGGLTWTLRQRSNSQAGTAEIWQATTTANVSNATVTATRKGSYKGDITVVSFINADTATNGVTAGASAATGAPSVSLTTTRNNSWVWATGNDWDRAVARTVGSGQTIADQYVDSSSGDTYWSQYSTATTPSAGTKVTLNDTAPTGDRWNVAAIEILSASTDTTAPTVPAALTATAASATQVNLSWTASTDSVGVTGYKVYRSTVAGFVAGPSNLVTTVAGTATSYTDSGLVPGTYYYLVQAQDAAGNSSAASNQASATLSDVTAPSAPSNLSGVVTNAKVALTWTASTDNVGVAGYKVYRSTVAGFTPDPSSLVTTTTSLNYTDLSLAPGTYYYLVNAVDAAGNTSVSSNQYTATVNPSDLTPPTAPAGLTASASSATTAALSWTASSDDVGVAAYQVYRSTSDGFVPSSTNQIASVGANTLAYNDTTVPGTYYYVVTASDAAGNVSPASNQAQAILTDTTAPSVPANLTATATSSTQASLNWTASTDNVGVAAYQVYRGGVQIASTTTPSYIDSALAPGTTYSYVVTASDAAGNVSAQSTTANVTTAASNVLFSDNFSGTSLSPAWTAISRHGEYSQSESECNTPGQVGVANNTLTISTIAQLTSCGDFNVDGSVRHTPSSWPYATGDIQWSSLNFTYGTVSVTAKFPPKSSHTWPAIWMLGSNCQKTNPMTADTGYDTCPPIQTKAYAEIDNTECFDTTWCQMAMNLPGGWITCNYHIAVDTNWHTYSMAWTPTSVSTYIDGQSTGCTFTSSQYAIPSTPMFLIIQTQTGGIGGTPANLPTSFQVSNVTVTQP